MFGMQGVIEQLDSVCDRLDAISAQMDMMIRLLQILVEQQVEFEPDEDAFGLAETMTA